MLDVMLRVVRRSVLMLCAVVCRVHGACGDISTGASITLCLNVLVVIVLCFTPRVVSNKFAVCYAPFVVGGEGWEEDGVGVTLVPPLLAGAPPVEATRA